VLLEKNDINLLNVKGREYLSQFIFTNVIT